MIIKTIGFSRAITLISACLITASCWAGDDSAKLVGIVDATIRPLMAKYDVPGMAIAITIDGQARYFNYGVAAKDGAIPVSQTTLFEIGSVSKTFTATLAVYAQILGKLSLSGKR